MGLRDVFLLLHNGDGFSFGDFSKLASGISKDELMSGGLSAPSDDFRGATLLSMACKKGYLRTIGWLLENGADPNMALGDSYGGKRDALSETLGSSDGDKREAVVRILLLYGANAGSEAVSGVLDKRAVQNDRIDRSVLDMVKREREAVEREAVVVRKGLSSTMLGFDDGTVSTVGHESLSPGELRILDCAAIGDVLALKNGGGRTLGVTGNKTASEFNFSAREVPTLANRSVRRGSTPS